MKESILTKVGLDFTNALYAALMHTDPKSAKRQSSHQCLFALLGSASVKAAHKLMMKLTLRGMCKRKISFFRHLTFYVKQKTYIRKNIQ